MTNATIPITGQVLDPKLKKNMDYVVNFELLLNTYSYEGEVFDVITRVPIERRTVSGNPTPDEMIDLAHTIAFNRLRQYRDAGGV